MRSTGIFGTGDKAYSLILSFDTINYFNLDCCNIEFLFMSAIMTLLIFSKSTKFQFLSASGLLLLVSMGDAIGDP